MHNEAHHGFPESVRKLLVACPDVQQKQLTPSVLSCKESGTAKHDVF
jgi:hypothetical protein